jgi:hypothetical protein
MQDRYRRLDEILLRRTAGPYIGSKAERLRPSTTLPLYPQKQTSERTSSLSVQCHKPTCRLIDHLVGTGEYGGRYRNAEHLGGLQIDNQLEFD